MRYRNTPRGDIGTSPSNILFERKLEKQLQAATDVSKIRKQAMATGVPKVREHRHPEGEGAHSLTNLTDLRWREKPGKVVEKLGFINCLAKVEGVTKRTRENRRISTSAVKEKVYAFDGGSKKADGEDERKGEDRLRRRYNW